MDYIKNTKIRNIKRLRNTLRYRTTNVPVNEIRGQRTGDSQTTNKIANGTIVHG